MVVVAATRAESGMYTCAATNEFGYDEATFQLVVQGTVFKYIIYMVVEIFNCWATEKYMFI